MANTNNGGSAFPIMDRDEVWSDGMSLRDYFAAKAMQALAPVYAKDEHVGEGYIAEWAYVQADAMLKAREWK